MKKLLASLLALMLVLANVAALAEGGAEDNGMPSTPGAANDVIENESNDAVANASGNGTSIKKNYTTTGTATNVYPTETLQFTVTPESAEYPTVTVGTENTFTTDGTQTQTIPVNVPEASVYGKAGMYHYTVTEKTNPDDPSQGAAYNTDNITFNVDVYVYYDPNEKTKLVKEVVIYSGDAATSGIPTAAKTDAFENTYSVGSLEVSKEITGNLADPTKPFTIVITLNASAKVNNDIAIVNNATSIDGDDDGKIAKGWTGTKTITITAVGGQSIKLDNIPTGVTYTVAETLPARIAQDTAANQIAQVNNAEAYFVSGEVSEATAIGTTAATATITNKKDITVPTGIALDSIPYVLIMSLAVIALVALKARKREEF